MNDQKNISTVARCNGLERNYINLYTNNGLIRFDRRRSYVESIKPFPLEHDSGKSKTRTRTETDDSDSFLFDRILPSIDRLSPNKTERESLLTSEKILNLFRSL